MKHEAIAVRLVSYGAYVLGIGGAAVYIGLPWGALLVALAGAIPGGFLLYRDQSHGQLMKEQAAWRGQPYQRPPDRSNGAPAAPEPLTMPPPTP